MAYRIRRVVLDSRAGRAAMAAVKAAVKARKLPNLKRRIIKCADCDDRAVDYDHRHYSEPLKVEPVCRRHNMARGFALDQTFKDAITGEPRTLEDYRTDRCRRSRHTDYAYSGRPGYLKESAERAGWNERRIRGRRQIAIEKGRAYLNAEHEYVLRHGGKNTDQRKTMTGFEAKRLNEAAEREFINQLQTDKTKRLCRWCLAERIDRGYVHTHVGVWQRPWTHKRFGRA